MHTPETRQKFIKLRTQGWSYVRLAAELGVAVSTLIEWSRQLRCELQNQQAIESDDVKYRLLGPRQARANGLSEKLAAIEGELRKRDLTTVSTQGLYALSASLRRQIDQTLGNPNFMMPTKDIPADEPSDDVQQWKP